MIRIKVGLSQRDKAELVMRNDRALEKAVVTVKRRCIQRKIRYSQSRGDTMAGSVCHSGTMLVYRFLSEFWPSSPFFGGDRNYQLKHDTLCRSRIDENTQLNGFDCEGSVDRARCFSSTPPEMFFEPRYFLGYTHSHIAGAIKMLDVSWLSAF